MGNPCHVRLFPDTFGNMGQTPQLMKQAGISAAAFGRGVNQLALIIKFWKQKTILPNTQRCGGKDLIKQQSLVCYLPIGIATGMRFQ